MKPSNESERISRDTEDFFGHINERKTLKEYLQTTYHKDSSKYRRYKNVLDSIFPEHNGNVLELGAGVGDLSFFCKSLYPQNNYTVSELSLNFLLRHAEETGQFFCVNPNDIALKEFGAEIIPYPNGYFSVVMVKAAVHHFEDTDKSFREIHRVLKPNGVLVFIEDPICLNIPIYTSVIKHNFCKEERSMGINEHIYTRRDYLGFGYMFKKRTYTFDPVLVSEFHKNQANRKGLKKLLFSIIGSSTVLTHIYLIKKFTSCILFEFTK